MCSERSLTVLTREKTRHLQRLYRGCRISTGRNGMALWASCACWRGVLAAGFAVVVIVPARKVGTVKI